MHCGSGPRRSIRVSWLSGSRCHTISGVVGVAPWLPKVCASMQRRSKWETTTQPRYWSYPGGGIQVRLLYTVIVPLKQNSYHTLIIYHLVACADSRTCNLLEVRVRRNRCTELWIFFTFDSFWSYTQLSWMHPYVCCTADMEFQNESSLLQPRHRNSNRP